MKKTLVLALGAAILFWVGSTPNIVGGGSLFNYAANAFFGRVSTQEEIKQKFEDDQLKILIVPGHNNQSPGAVYKSVRETDLNVSLSYKIKKLLEEENIYVLATRDENGDYARWFTQFLQSDREYIANFRDESRKKFQDQINSGAVTDFLGGVGHNYASSDASLELYAVNAYANMNSYDIVLHVHFNNEGGRKNNKIGKYAGFAVYVPESQLPNAEVSRTLGEEIKKALEEKFKVSSLPQENAGLIQSQDLIALGSNASRSGASVLIEYAYIYEAPLRASATREAFLDSLATQTFSGVMRYLKPQNSQN